MTAVWTQLSRLEATAQTAGLERGPTPEPSQELHVIASGKGFDLRWQRGLTVLESQHVPRVAVQSGAEARYPALADAITQSWRARGEHRAASDRRLDRAVLHVQDDLPFSEIVAVLDALHAPRRGHSSAFDVAFSAN